MESTSKHHQKPKLKSTQKGKGKGKGSIEEGTPKLKLTQKGKRSNEEGTPKLKSTLKGKGSIEEGTTPKLKSTLKGKGSIQEGTTPKLKGKGSIEVAPVATPKLKSIPDALPAVLSAKFNHDGNLIISGGADKQPRVWKTSDGTLRNSYGSMLTNNSEVRDVSLSEDESRLAACYANGLIVSYDTSTGDICNHFQGQGDGVNAAKLNEFGSVLVSAESRCVRFWDCRTNNSRPIQIFDTFTGSVTSLGLRRTEIVAASLDGSVQLFDLRNNKRLCHELGPPVASFHISETNLLASCLDATIRLLDVGTKSIEREDLYKGHRCQSTKVGCCFTPGYRHVLGGSEDGKIFLWKMMNRGVDRSFKAHASAVTSVEYHPSDRCILSASTDGSIVLWKEDMRPKHILY